MDSGLGPVTPQGKAYADWKFHNESVFRPGDFGGWAGVDRNFFGKGEAREQIFARTR